MVPEFFHSNEMNFPWEEIPGEENSISKDRNMRSSQWLIFPQFERIQNGGEGTWDVLAETISLRAYL